MFKLSGAGTDCAFTQRRGGFNTPGDSLRVHLQKEIIEAITSLVSAGLQPG